MTTLDGRAIFGDAVSVCHNARTDGRRLAHFFELEGSKVRSVTDGSRTFVISGVLTGANLREVQTAEERILAYADGETHTLVDARGRAWPNVIFRGDYIPAPTGPQPLAGGGWCLPYRLLLEQAG